MSKNFLNSRAIVCLCFLVTGIFAVAQAQEEQQVQEKQVKPEKQRKCYLSLGGSVFIVNDNVLGGGNFTFGFMPSPKNLLSVEIGGLGGGSKQIGSYSYTLYKKDSNGHIIDHETKNDGKVTYSYSSLEVMLSWNWLFKLSEKWKFRLGPSIGIVNITGSDHYSPTSYKGVDIEGIPKTQSDDKSGFMFGAIAGVQWNFAKRWFLDINYRISGNTAIDFPERSISVPDGTAKLESKDFGGLGNRVNVGVGLRL
jgi:opacity protein-like surface antigen